jgi:hypothetical protein
VGPEEVAESKELTDFVHVGRRFGFFRSHVRNFATIASPLTKLTRKESLWRKDAYLAFRELQTILVSEPVVDYPRRDQPYALFSDASFGDDNMKGGWERSSHK